MWLRYDKAFHQKAAINPGLQWDSRDTDLWLAAESKETLPPPTAHTSTPPGLAQSRYVVAGASVCVQVPASIAMPALPADRQAIHLGTAPPCDPLCGDHRSDA